MHIYINNYLKSNTGHASCNSNIHSTLYTLVNQKSTTDKQGRVPTSSGNPGKPGKSLKKVPCMEKSWNLEKPE